MLYPGPYVIHVENGLEFLYPQWIHAKKGYETFTTDSITKHVTLADLLVYKTVEEALGAYLLLVTDNVIGPIMAITLRLPPEHVGLDDYIARLLSNDSSSIQSDGVTITQLPGAYIAVEANGHWTGYIHTPHETLVELRQDAVAHPDRYCEALGISKACLSKWILGETEVGALTFHSYVVS